jgi:CubicO group peptidase (beta-lactamase class C family)
MTLGVAGAQAAENSQKTVDDIMHAYAGDVPGASVLVIRNGKPLVRVAYGLSNLEEHVAATPATNYRLASVTKQFTAASILLLAEDKRLSIDDPIRKWLPSLPDTDDGITIQHLLTHTGGLIDYEDIMPADLSVALRDVDVLHLLEKERRVYFAPGTDYRYSNGGYSMLALIVEKASGKSFQAFLRERIFEPLGMHDTLAYVVEGSPVPNRAYGYTQMNGKWESGARRWRHLFVDRRPGQVGRRALRQAPAQRCVTAARVHAVDQDRRFGDQVWIRLAHYRYDTVAFGRECRFPQRDRALSSAAPDGGHPEQPRRSGAVSDGVENCARLFEIG